MKRLSSYVLVICAIVFLQQGTAQERSEDTRLDTWIEFEFSKVKSSAGDSRLLGVAFQSLYFIDSYGNRVGDSLAFGYAAASSSLGTGWYDAENDQNLGLIRWGGGEGKKATLHFDVPEGAEAIIIRVKGIDTTQWMRTTVGGIERVRVLVDPYWHSAYIPIAAIKGEIRPITGPVWTDGLYFPKFPRTDSVYIIHVHTTWGNSNGWNLAQRVDWRIRDTNDMTALTLVGMQGIINRYGARVYFEWDDPFGISSSWIPKVKENLKTKFFDFDGLGAINFLYRRFSSCFSGVVIYDPEVPETINLATMFAGVDNAIMVAPGEVGLPGIPQLSSVNDLRTLVQQNGWKATNEDQTRIYQWVYDNLYSRLDHRILGIVSPGPPTSRPYEPGSSQYFPAEIMARDYFVALKLPCIYLHPKEEPQKSLLVKFLDGAPSPVPVSGVFAGWEAGTQETISEHGDMSFGLTWPGAIFTGSNFSVFASIDVQPKKFVPRIDPQKILRFCSGAPAATMFPTDGDATNYTMQYGYTGFDWRKVQGQNAGWTIASYLCNFAPVIWNYYLKSANQLSFLSDVNGAGYMINWCMNDAQLAKYLKNTATYLQMSGLDVIHIFEGLKSNYFWTGGQAAKYYEHLRTSGYRGAILGYGADYHRGIGFYYAGSPAPTVRASHKLNSTNLEWTLKDLGLRKPGEELYDFSNRPDEQCYLSPGAQFVDDSDALSGKAVSIPKSFGRGMIMSVGPMSLAPGRYEVKMRMKVRENTSTAKVIALSLLYFGPLTTYPSTNFGSRSVSPSEFVSPGKYQDVTLTFALDQFVTDVYYWLECSDQYAAGTEFTIDFIRSTNLDGSNLPVIGTIVLDNINYMERSLETVTASFASRFESNGGVVLNPSEYVAALNPEYMKEFAKPMLGSSHPAIADAQSKFVAGKYFESLMTIRVALGQRVAERPIAPLLLAPAHQSPNLPVNVALSWASSVGAMKYHLQVSQDSLFSSCAVNDSMITTTLYQLSSLTNGATYYWRVRGRTATGSGDWSTSWSFMTTRGTMSLSVSAGWNIVSVPLQASDMNPSSFFPDASSQAFGFNNGYDFSSLLTPGKGYWLKFPAGKSYTVSGASVRPANISLAAGWNMIGPFDFDIPTSSITSVPAGIVASSYFGYNNGYTTATTLAVGRGYWVKALQAGTLTLQQPGATSAGRKVALATTHPQETGKVVEISIEDNAGARGVLQLLEGSTGEELPPVPPAGIFDVRFASNVTKELLCQGTHEVWLNSAQFPVTIVVRGLGEMELILKDGAGGAAVNERLIEGKKITIAQNLSKLVLVEPRVQLPTHYELIQNYPNPFNPSTTIEYQIPKQSFVTLKVFDLLGREVRTLVDKQQVAGKYSVRFDASGLSSGVLIYRLGAGNFSQTRKLLLMK